MIRNPFIRHLLAALLLLVGQAAFAVHQAGHEGLQSDIQCSICLAGESLGHGATSVLATPVAQPAQIIIRFDTQLEYIGSAPRLSSIRAPPRFS